MASKVDEPKGVDPNAKTEVVKPGVDYGRTLRPPEATLDTNLTQTTTSGEVDAALAEAPKRSGTVLFFKFDEVLRLTMEHVVISITELTQANEGVMQEDPPGSGNIFCCFTGDNSNESALTVHRTIQKESPFLDRKHPFAIASLIWPTELAIRSEQSADGHVYYTPALPIPREQLQGKDGLVAANAIVKSSDARHVASIGVKHEDHDIPGFCRILKILHLSSMEVTHGPQKMHGRDEEMEMVVTAIEDFAEKNGITIEINGPAGIGKTRFIKELFKILKEKFGDRFAHLAVRARQRESNVSWSYLRRFIAHLQVEAQNKGVQLNPQTTEALDTFRQSPARYFKGTVRTSQDLFKAANALLTLVTEASGKLACFTDDDQWIDPSSAPVMAQLMSSAIPNLIRLAPARDRAGEMPKDMRSGIDDAEKTGIVKVVKLSLTPLSLSDIQAGGETAASQVLKDWITDQLELPDDAEFPFAISEVQEITKRTNGTPLSLWDFIETMVAMGYLAKGVGKTVPTIPFDRLPHDEKGIYEHQLAKEYKPQEIQVFQWVETLSPCTGDLFKKVLPSGLKPTYDNLVQRGIITSDDDEVELYNPVFSETIKYQYKKQIATKSKVAAAKYQELSPDEALKIYSLARTGKNNAIMAHYVKKALEEALSRSNLREAEAIAIEASRSPALRWQFDRGEFQFQMADLYMSTGDLGKSEVALAQALHSFKESHAEPAKVLPAMRLRRKLYYTRNRPKKAATDTEKEIPADADQLQIFCDQDRKYLGRLENGGDEHKQLAAKAKWSLNFDEACVSYRKMDYASAKAAFEKIAAEADTILTTSPDEASAELWDAFTNAKRLLATIEYLELSEGHDDDAIHAVFRESPVFHPKVRLAHKKFQDYVASQSISHTGTFYNPNTHIRACVYAAYCASLAADTYTTDLTQRNICLAEAERLFSEAIGKADDGGFGELQAMARYERGNTYLLNFVRNPNDRSRWANLDKAATDFLEAGKEADTINNKQYSSCSKFGYSAAVLEQVKLKKKKNTGEYNPLADLMTSFEAYLESYEALKAHKGFEKASDLEPDQFMHFSLIPHFVELFEQFTAHATATKTPTINVPEFIDQKLIDTTIKLYEDELSETSRKNGFGPYCSEISRKLDKLVSFKLRQFGKSSAKDRMKV